MPGWWGDDPKTRSTRKMCFFRMYLHFSHFTSHFVPLEPSAQCLRHPKIACSFWCCHGQTMREAANRNYQPPCPRSWGMPPCFCADISKMTKGATAMPLYLVHNTRPFKLEWSFNQKGNEKENR